MCFKLFLLLYFLEPELIFVSVKKIVETKRFLRFWAMFSWTVWPFCNKCGKWVRPLVCIMKGVKHSTLPQWGLIIFLTFWKMSIYTLHRFLGCRIILLYTGLLLHNLFLFLFHCIIWFPHNFFVKMYYFDCFEALIYWFNAFLLGCSCYGIIN